MAVETTKMIEGSDLMLFFDDKPLAFSNNASLEITRESKEVSSKDSTGDWKDFIKGKVSWTASTDGLMAFTLTGTTLDNEDLFAYINSGAEINVVFGIKTGTSPDWTVDSAQKYYSGTGFVTSFSMGAGDNDSATYSISIQGTSALTIV